MMRASAFVLFLLLQVTQAQTEQQQQSSSSTATSASIDYAVAVDSVSNALSVVVHGGGTLNLTGLSVWDYDDDDDEADVHLQAVILPLDRSSSSSSSSSISLEEVHANGLGATGSDGNYYVCCNEAAIAANACSAETDEQQELYYPIIAPSCGDSTTRTSTTRGGCSIQVQSVPARTSSSSTSSTEANGGRVPRQQSGVIRIRQTSHLAVVFLNCQQQSAEQEDTSTSSPLRVQGTVSWTSSVTTGILPFFALITVLHTGLCLWYRFLMVRHEASRINVENWIFLTLALAAVTSVVETGNYVGALFESNEILFFKIVSMLLSLARHSVTRCLYLVLSLGLGVAVRSLSMVTTLLVVTFLALDVFLLWAMHMAFYMNIHIHVNRHLLTWLEKIFTYWIPTALLFTMYRLWKRKEDAKLFRYKVFLGIYFLIVLATFLERGVILKQGGSRGGVSYREANDIIYLLPLVCIAILWKPNPEQRKYSHSYVLLEDGKEEENTVLAMGGGAGVYDEEGSLELTEYHPDDDEECDGEYNDGNK